MPEQVAEKAVPVPVAAPTNNNYQVQISASDVNIYNFAMAHLRTLPGIASATPQLINPTGTSYVLVAYHGDIAALAAALSGRGWQVDFSGTVIHLRAPGNKPPPLPPPPASAPAATASQPAAPAPGQHP
jgi:hypothetical protein